ncbi:MAG: VTT domain-containing protein [Trichloromonadaceae bacterium]
MELVALFLDMFLHIDQFLAGLVENHGTLVYVIIALIIFCEVGLVVAPFLPGDSMLFIIGALCATGTMDLTLVLILFPLAAIAGDNFNRYLGATFGYKAFCGRQGRFFNQKNLDRAQRFFEKYGNWAITLCRFIPFFRTFIPFVAGMAGMRWRTFFLYSVVGGVGWIAVCVLAGYYLGNLEFIKGHFELVLLTIITVSVLPAVIKYMKKSFPPKGASGLSGELPVESQTHTLPEAFSQERFGKRFQFRQVVKRGRCMAGWPYKVVVIAADQGKRTATIMSRFRILGNRCVLRQRGSRPLRKQGDVKFLSAKPFCTTCRLVAD